MSLRGLPRNRSADALTSTARKSLVKSMTPSCRLAIIWSRFSFNAEKTSWTLRICRPRRSILVETAPYSSERRGGSSVVSACPAVIRSRRRLMASSGCSARLESAAATSMQMKMAPPESNSALRIRSCTWSFKNTVETPTRTSPKGLPSRIKGKRTS